MNATILALIGYISWTVFLLVVIAVYRTRLVLTKERLPNGFKADGSDSPAFGQRLTRAQLNCAESFVFTGGVMLLALATNSSVITDPLALWLLGARIGQSIMHLLSTSVLAVQIRFALFVVQVVISAYWLFNLGSKFVA
ncbi:MAPEG family protein [Aliiglaciecola litoralis]|uniref:MAPEG family protein n=1 Tax=Aliiglaciecola litoralis TaxID=582857 RepID=A0ABP3X604_9ALTE